jgi:hypothetical protein
MNPDLKRNLATVTPLSKILAMVIFIVLPFVGVYIGYTFAPEKVVEVERAIEKVVESQVAQDIDSKAVEYQIFTASEEYQESRIFTNEVTPLPILHSQQGFIFMNRVPVGDRVMVHKLNVPDFEGGYSYEAVDPQYVKSSARVLFIGLYGYKPRIVDGADPATFVPLESGFMRDANSVFYLGEKIPGVKPEGVVFDSFLSSSDQTEWVVMKTAESVWVPSGCGPYTYEQITMEELESYRGPC